MKKIVRIVWIGALSGLAFLTACWTHNGLTRKERKQLTEERDLVQWRLLSYGMGGIHDYTSVNEYVKACNKRYSLENKLDSINFRLGDSIDLDRNIRRRQILQRIDSLNYLIENYIPPCIYGSPEMLEEYKYEVYTQYDVYQDKLKAAQKELEELDNIKTEGSEI